MDDPALASLSLTHVKYVQSPLHPNAAFDSPPNFRRILMTPYHIYRHG